MYILTRTDLYVHISGLLQEEPEREEVFLSVLLVNNEILEAGHRLGEESFQ